MLEEMTETTETPMAVKQSDLKEMSSKQLRDLVTKANELIAERMVAEKQEGRQKVQAIAEELGISIYDLVGIQKPQKGRPAGNGTRKPAASKYRLPDGNEWSGRGRIPLVLREALEGTKGWDAEAGNFEDAEAREEGLKKFLL